MKSKLRILAITLIMVLGFGLVSVNAEDATRYYIYVNGVELTSAQTSVDAGSGTVSYNATTKELTFNNATISSTMADATQGVISIRNGEAVTIKLVGTNTITNTGASQGIDTTSNLKITGDGSLTITTGGYGILLSLMQGTLTVKDTTLNVTSTASDGIYSYGNLVIDNSVIDLKATGNYMGAISTYMAKNQLTFKNLTGKIFQKSNSPITADKEASDPSSFNPESGYHYVKISNKGILSKIAITLKEPVVGETPATTFTSTVDAKGSATPDYTIWLKAAKDKYVKDDPTKSDWEPVGENEKFQKDYYYAFVTLFELNDGYEASDVVATINGKEADLVKVGRFMIDGDAVIDGVQVANFYGPLTEAEKAKSPATGDNNELGLFAVAGLISVAGVALMLRRKHSM